MTPLDLFDRFFSDPNQTNVAAQASRGISANWPWTRSKTAASKSVQDAVGSVMLRRKMKTRGFYKDPSPGMYGLKDGFNSAAKGEGTKLAGAKAAVRNFLHGKEKDPISALTDLYKHDDFGLPRRTNSTMVARSRAGHLGALQGRSASSTAQSLGAAQPDGAYTGV